jgi:hypothetical protein
MKNTKTESLEINIGFFIKQIQHLKMLQVNPLELSRNIPGWHEGDTVLAGDGWQVTSDRKRGNIEHPTLNIQFVTIYAKTRWYRIRLS